MSLPTSPYCTIGPFFPGDFAEGCSDMTNFQGKRAAGPHILLTGRVLEEGSRPIRNAVVEIWQPDASGVFRHPLDPRANEADPGFFGWGRVRTDEEGRFTFRTVLPGTYNEDGAERCAHINLMVLAIGLTRRLVTTVFFADTPELASDPILDCIPDPVQRKRLFASREEGRDGPGSVPVYRFDVTTRGEAETPFFVD
jgi:protocatechuate 3,4-dioxygenase alpha subunit